MTAGLPGIVELFRDPPCFGMQSADKQFWIYDGQASQMPVPDNKPLRRTDG